MGYWKGARQQLQKGATAIQLYNLADDIGEKNDLAAKHPDIVARIEKIMKAEHVASAIFPLKSIDQPAK